MENPGEYHFLYSNGVMTRLDLLEAVVAGGWTDLHPVRINDRGQIVGSGFQNGVRRAFLLEDVATLAVAAAH